MKENSKNYKLGVFEGNGRSRRVFIEDIGLIDDFMASDDLNTCVEALLQKRPKHFSNPRAAGNKLDGTVKNCADNSESSDLENSESRSLTL